MEYLSTVFRNSMKPPGDLSQILLEIFSEIISKGPYIKDVRSRGGGGQPKADTCGHVGEVSEAKCGRPHLWPYFDKTPNFSPDLAFWHNFDHLILLNDWKVY